MQATLFKTTGEEIELNTPFSLEDLQKHVGGYIEIHKLPDGRSIVINEDGMRLKLPPNASATILAYSLHTSSHGILGDVVICDSELLE